MNPVETLLCAVEAQGARQICGMPGDVARWPAVSPPGSGSLDRRP